MRKFLVNVNGTSYEITVEEIDGKAAAAQPGACRRACTRCHTRRRACTRCHTCRRACCRRNHD